jgi:hypothetical protein
MLLPDDPRHLNSRFDLESIKRTSRAIRMFCPRRSFPSIGTNSTVRFRKLKPRAHAARGFGSLEMAGQPPSRTIFYAIGLRGHSPLRTPPFTFIRSYPAPPSSQPAPTTLAMKLASRASSKCSLSLAMF